jgi:hypothetical protein
MYPLHKRQTLLPKAILRYMATNSNQTIKTLSNVMDFMAPFAGGAVPDANSVDYANWVRWIGVKQEEYAVRGFWRRLLTKDTLTITKDKETTLLPDNFHKANGLYILDVNGVDWAEADNEDEQRILVEMVVDPTDENFGKWQVRFNPIPTETVEATIWYFANPPRPTAPTDILILPGDMVGYGALIEHYRKSGAEGSMDKVEQDAENRFNTYLSLEMIPPKYELLRFNGKTQINHLTVARTYYSTRTNRNTQL